MHRRRQNVQSLFDNTKNDFGSVNALVNKPLNDVTENGSSGVHHLVPRTDERSGTFVLEQRLGVCTAQTFTRGALFNISWGATEICFRSCEMPILCIFDS